MVPSLIFFEISSCVFTKTIILFNLSEWWLKEYLFFHLAYMQKWKKSKRIYSKCPGVKTQCLRQQVEKKPVQPTRSYPCKT